MKHLADHRSASTGAKLKNFLRLASRSPGEVIWRQFHQRDRLPKEGNRRVLEYVRIERGRQV